MLCQLLRLYSTKMKTAVNRMWKEAAIAYQCLITSEYKELASSDLLNTNHCYLRTQQKQFLFQYYWKLLMR
jgi:hypothetical protein